MKIFESFSSNQTINELWRIDPDDNARLVISCMEELDLEDADFEIYYGIIETVTMSRAPGLPSYGSKHWRSCFVQKESGALPDLMDGHLNMKWHDSVVARLRKDGNKESYFPVVDVLLRGLTVYNDAQAEEFGRIYTERFKDYFGNVYTVEECEWNNEEDYSVRLYMKL